MEDAAPDVRRALIEAINEHPGAVILVSHDRYLIEACADRLWLVAAGTCTSYEGDMDDYRQMLLDDRRGGRASNGRDRAEATGNGGEPAGHTAAGRKEQRRAAAEQTRASEDHRVWAGSVEARIRSARKTRFMCASPIRRCEARPWDRPTWRAGPASRSPWCRSRCAVRRKSANAAGRSSSPRRPISATGPTPSPAR